MSSNGMGWVNYGDVNPIENGGIFVQQDGATTFKIIKLFFDDNLGKNVLWDMYVDVSDNWIDRKAVNDYGNLQQNAVDYDTRLAIECISYYAPDNFGCTENVFLELEETAEYLSPYGIQV
ncbi:hypothetical protein ABGV42_01195 [Paenibacillus pabuli]|uniref:hypothetical protein n=1 Tax=Paenibacillus pabuli TaxID=1472 RepID=UPI0032425ABA